MPDDPTALRPGGADPRAQVRLGVSHGRDHAPLPGVGEPGGYRAGHEDAPGQPVAPARRPRGRAGRRAASRVRTVDEHLAEVLVHAQALESLDVSLLESRGCLLAEPVTAPWALPPFDAAGTDGYAVMAADVATATSGDAGHDARHRRRPGRATAPAIRSWPGTAIRIGSGRAPAHRGDGRRAVRVHRRRDAHGVGESGRAPRARRPARRGGPRPRARRSCPPGRSWVPGRWRCWPPSGGPG